MISQLEVGMFMKAATEGKAVLVNGRYGMSIVRMWNREKDPSSPSWTTRLDVVLEDGAAAEAYLTWHEDLGRWSACVKKDNLMIDVTRIGRPGKEDPR